VSIERSALLRLLSTDRAALFRSTNAAQVRLLPALQSNNHVFCLRAHSAEAIELCVRTLSQSLGPAMSRLVRLSADQLPVLSADDVISSK
jgi:hypothetical protein